ncbi:MAG: hypothetical protein EU544_03560 [Promethearchaeota archaeon]|nr:MAG: hypothetical protein EU544_03560 [Candidatus Lokiarchaeota archaeon]
MMEIREIEKEIGITDENRTQIYTYCKEISSETREELTDGLLRLLLVQEKGPLKTELGKVIFHLQKNERLNTLIGLQKLVHAGLIVAPEEMYKILETSDQDAQELAQKIKNIL